MKNEDYENDFMQNLVNRMNEDLNDSGVTVSFEPSNNYDEDDEAAEDFSCYSLGDGTAIISEYYGDKKVVNIPEIMNGLKIVGIKTFAFPDNDNVDVINIPKSIEFIEVSAFPEVVEFNVDKDNPNYTSCDGVIYNKDMTSLVRYPARNKRNKFIIPESVKTIEGLSLIHANNLNKLYLSKNIKKFNKCVFGSFDKIDDIYYEGTESDWKKVVIEDGNDCLDGKHINQSTIHFNKTDEKKSISSSKIVIKSNEEKNITQKADEISSNQSNDFVYSKHDDDSICIEKYVGVEKNVIIPPTVDGHIVSSILLHEKTYMDTITIPKDIIFISVSGVENLRSINVSSDNEEYSSIDGVLFDKNQTTLIKYPIDKKEKHYKIPNTVINIGRRAFYKCKNLECLSLSSNIKEISDTNFAFNENLSDIYYSGLKTQWDNIHIEMGNSDLKYITIHYNEQYLNKRKDNSTNFSYEANKTLSTGNSSNSSNDTNSGGCYVATCVYGSYDCPEVWTLRRFRDCALAKTWHGRAFIHTYYALAPTFVKMFGGTKWFKSIWRSLLNKKIKKLNDEGIENTPYQDIEW